MLEIRLSRIDEIVSRIDELFLLLRDRLSFRSLLDKYLYYLAVSWRYDS